MFSVDYILTMLRMKSHDNRLRVLVCLTGNDSWLVEHAEFESNIESLLTSYVDEGRYLNIGIYEAPLDWFDELPAEYLIRNIQPA